MPLSCNIDARGKRVRLGMGLAMLIAAVVLAVIWAWPAGDWRRWAAVGALAAFGGFAVFEARAGWCAVRAMGFRTKV